LTVKGTIFIDGSATVDPSGAVARYLGNASIILTGTFAMKNSILCAVASASDCNWNTAAWDPNAAALLIAADGDGGSSTVQNQGNTVAAGEGIDLKSSSYQGVLLANKTVNVQTTSNMQGPMISVYNQVLGGQSGVLTFPTINLAPSGGGGITQPLPLPQLLAPRSFGG
jgi:hypothetical protein